MTLTEPYPNVGPPFDPPPVEQYTGPIESVVRHPFAALAPVLLLVGVALFLGMSRSPTYSAESRINVGRADVPAFTLQNVIAGNQALAASYSRAIQARRVLLKAGRSIGIGPDAAGSRLTASPVPGSTLIRVDATGPSKRDAAKLANAGARSLIAYVTRLQAKMQHAGLLTQFRDAQAAVDRRGLRLRSLLRRHASRSALAAAHIDLLTAQLRTQRLRNQYNSSLDGPSPTSPLEMLAPANEVSSDFSSMLERMLLVGAAAGLIVGIGLALALANADRLRRRRWT